jgi:hypothetical protein
VPELSRFFGIVIRMFSEAGSPHHVAHFHAWYQDHVGVFGVDPVELIAGELPQRQRRLAEAWLNCIRRSCLPTGNCSIRAGGPSQSIR